MHRCDSLTRRTLVVLATILASAGGLLSSCGQDEVTGPDPQAVTGDIWIGAGDIATCEGDRDEETAQVIDSLVQVYADATVFTVGDNVYENGTAAEYTNCYHPTWGRFLDRTWATIGNHEYQLGNADPTFDYFAERVGPRDKGYYSLDVGDWHVVMLNSGDRVAVPLAKGSEQEQWLRDDLAQTDKSCIMGVVHHWRFRSCVQGDGCEWEEDDVTDALWDALYEHGATLLVVAHAHRYERWAPVNPDGDYDAERGIRQIIVGTGGRSMAGTPAIEPAPLAEAVAPRSNYGVLKLTLGSDMYHWEYVPVEGKTWTDAGTGQCVPCASTDGCGA